MGDKVLVPGRDRAPNDDQAGGEQELQVGEVALEPPGVVGPVQVLAFPSHGRGPGLGLRVGELEVAQFQVRDQPSVDEQGRANPGAQEQDQHGAAGGVAPRSAAGAVADLGQPGRVGVVEHVHGPAQPVGEEALDLQADPGAVDVHGRTRHALAEDGGQGHPTLAS